MRELGESSSLGSSRCGRPICALFAAALVLLVLFGCPVEAAGARLPLRSNTLGAGAAAAAREERLSGRRLWAEDAGAAVSSGQPAGRHMFPFIAMLMGLDPVSKNIFWWGCAGTLASRDTVITAAHCVTDGSGKLERPNVFGVKIGLLNADMDTDTQYEFRTVKQVIVHEDYEPYSIANDIAVLKLSSPVRRTRHVLLPPLLRTRQPVLQEGDPLYVAGWGTTEAGSWSPALRYATVPFVPYAVCVKRYATWYIGVPPSHICAGQGTDPRRADTCSGDSGGPILIGMGANAVLVGVTSFGPSFACGTSATLNLGAYTSITAMRAWLKEKGGV